ncbi:putative ArsR-family transcriptional regulator [Clavibacter sepedonicus]|uniref:ArsR-family transcriptional regulator n=1 Tax=Clavibacter sepedonicus TaxID=31964 RepID=B0RCZ3_CLASE|nr:putative ArsR-family transcriptional regulator [Clavibacter sepedonicus]
MVGWRVPAEQNDLRDLRVIAHPLRLRLLSLCTRSPVSASEAARELGETQANVSYHLRRLREAGLLEEAGVERIRGGAARRYRHVPASGERLATVADGGLPLVAAALAAELTRRAALHAEGTRPVITDAALTVSTGTWIRVQDLARELGTVLHDDSARRPGDEDVAVSATVALFRTAATPAPTSADPVA